MGADADIVRRLTEEVFIGGNVGVIDELVADDFVTHDPPPGIPPTKDGFRQLAEMVAASFSDRKTPLDEFIDTTDGRVVENWIMTGRHTGEAFGLPPSGEEVHRPRDGDLPVRRREDRRALGFGRHERRVHEGRSASRVSSAAPRCPNETLARRSIHARGEDV